MENLCQILLTTVTLIKKISLYKMSYFSEPYARTYKIEIELDLSNYATKSDLKNATGVDTSQFAKKADLVSLKLSADLNKLSDLVKK